MKKHHFSVRMDIKGVASDIGMQAGSSPSCLVDAHSFTDTDNLCPEAVDVVGDLETYKDTEIIDLEPMTLSSDTEINQMVKEKFTCPICQGLLVRARILACGHHFCRECVYRWFRTRRMCPMCRKQGDLNVPSFYIDHFLDEVIDNSGNKQLKDQRVFRKRETESAVLDGSTIRMANLDFQAITANHFAQTVTSYSHGVTTDTSTQSTTRTHDTGV
ncbi:unnamed protein product [Calicophoron daubneyi]|uniref:RING-type domain-containing protein n=1 Tax=Calicophoron daubneyi TaxID=300641 RepID=A0AAV2T5K9_CALDB